MKPNIPFCKFMSVILLVVIPISALALDYTYHNFGEGGGIAITSYRGVGGAIIIPDTINGLPVTTISPEAFLGNANITSIIVPDSVTHVRDGAFKSCQSLKSITFGKSFVFFDYNILFNCNNLTDVNIDEENPHYSSLDGVFFNKSQTTLYLCPPGKVGAYSIPDGTTQVSLGITAFANCSRLTSITVPSSVATMYTYTFEGCSNLAVYFLGDAPEKAGFFGTIFSATDNVTVYYLPNTIGWSNPFSGAPAVLLRPLSIQQDAKVQTNGFSFTVLGMTNSPFVVEVKSSISDEDWIPLKTTNLVHGSHVFCDSYWTNFTTRFYRVRSPE